VKSDATTQIETEMLLIGYISSRFYQMFGQYKSTYWFRQFGLTAYGVIAISRFIGNATLLYVYVVRHSFTLPFNWLGGVCGNVISAQNLKYAALTPFKPRLGSSRKKRR
jgi:hypothetical protein